jgi:hypothetical protein
MDEGSISAHSIDPALPVQRAPRYVLCPCAFSGDTIPPLVFCMLGVLISMNDSGYVNYFEVLGLPEDAKPGEVRKTYRRMMKSLVQEIATVEITEDRRAHYLLDMAKLNAALYILRDQDLRKVYWERRQELIRIEQEWREAAAKDSPEESEQRRRIFDTRLRDFLSRFVEEAMNDAGRDKECVDASNWNAAHERHAFRILRHYRHSLYQDILTRLPYWQITEPEIDWEERTRTVADILVGKEQPC